MASVNEEFARGLGSNGSVALDLCYETFGDRAAEPLLLIMGLGAQMTFWDTELCEMLAARGFHVIRFDNRDCGRSTAMSGRVDFARASLLRRTPYTLDAMAGDAVALLDHLGIPSAHVVGASMGGMIAQLLAIQHAPRVRSLTSIMSTTGSRWVGRPSLDGFRTLLTASPTEREAYIEHHVRLFQRISSPGYPPEEQRLRARAELSFDRGLNPAGRARHLGAVLAAGDRTAQLRRLQLPTTVIHGADDPLVSVTGGLATARAIRGAELHVINGMGHDQPPALFGRFADFIEHCASRATQPRFAG